MLIKVPKASDCHESDVTPESFYLSRRNVLGAAVAGLAVSSLPRWAGCRRCCALCRMSSLARRLPGLPKSFLLLKWGAVNVKDEAITPFKDATHYNNFYEFGTDKGDPAANAGALKTEPWSVVVDGEVGKPGRYALEDFMKPYQLEERIYRLRCVEAWSMVIPWIGFPISALLKEVEPTSKAKYIRFETLQDPKSMPGQRSGFALIDWPYVEGLRLDEAMNPLAILAVGMYGRELPNQNGAPLRLVVPWKYGFKSIKSIVRISLVSEQPKTTWQSIAADEYGFYANVNPDGRSPALDPGP